MDADIGVTGHEAQPSAGDGWSEEVVIHTDQGDIPGLFCPAPSPEAAVLWAGSLAGQGRTSPIAQDIGQGLLQEGISSLFLGYRSPRDLPSCIRDVQTGSIFLRDHGFQRIALVGHSFSGAVVISAAHTSPGVVAVVALASQTYGATGAGSLSPRPLLLVHGTDDRRLDPYCSEQIYSWAKKPKELVLLEGASHALLERKDDLLPLLHRWLADKLKA